MIETYDFWHTNSAGWLVMKSPCPKIQPVHFRGLNFSLIFPNFYMSYRSSASISKDVGRRISAMISYKLTGHFPDELEAKKLLRSPEQPVKWKFQCLQCSDWVRVKVGVGVKVGSLQSGLWSGFSNQLLEFLFGHDNAKTNFTWHSFFVSDSVKSTV